MRTFYIFQILDRYTRGRTWVKYPKEFQSFSDAESFQKEFSKLAPEWQTRISEGKDFSANVQTHPPAGGEQSSPENLPNQPNPAEPETNGGLGDVSCSGRVGGSSDDTGLDPSSDPLECLIFNGNPGDDNLEITLGGKTIKTKKSIIKESLNRMEDESLLDDHWVPVVSRQS